MSVLVGWADGDAASGCAQVCRREGDAINQRCPLPCVSTGFVRPSRGRQADAACTLRARESAAFACVAVVMAIPNTSPAGCLCACLLRRHSFGVCAAKCTPPALQSIQSPSLPGASGASGGLLLRESLERGVRVLVRMPEAWFDFCRDRNTNEHSKYR